MDRLIVEITTMLNGVSIHLGCIIVHLVVPNMVPIGSVNFFLSSWNLICQVNSFLIVFLCLEILKLIVLVEHMDLRGCEHLGAMLV